MQQPKFLFLLFAVLPLISVTYPARPSTTQTGSATETAEADSGNFIIEGDREGNTSCRPATAAESREMLRRDRNLRLKVISPGRYRLQSQLGLKIIMRSTSQLDSFPEAKAGFLRAASVWESRIQNPITIIVDVDYGPTRFGQPFGSNTLGTTSTQSISSSTNYPDIRNRLIAGASTPTETTLYNTLPADTVPTDIGSTSGVVGPTAAFRAVGRIAPVADPDVETSFGQPPAIGFNSAFNFDFDPANGIEPGRTDFESVAVHEIGHALGFTSRVGALEIDPNTALRISLFDLFRFRPGVTADTFSTAQRILSSGGEQIFFAGAGVLSLSTGRSDGTQGDGRQSSHWKDDALNSGRYIGVMDPTGGSGRRLPLTENDLMALNFMGYQVNLSDPLPLYPGVANNAWGGSAPAGQCLLPVLQYSVDVPEGATQLRLDLTSNSAINARLFARFSQSVAVQNNNFVFDHTSEGNGGDETIIISAASSPPLRAGRYFIVASNCSATEATLTLLANITPQPSVATTVSAANFQVGAQATESIVAAFGTGLATQTVAASSTPLPTTLAGTTVRLRDSAGNERLAPLFFVSAQQINFQIPPGTETGAATVIIASGDGRTAASNFLITSVSPALFTASSSGQGVAAALALRVKPGNVQTYEAVATFDSAQQKFVPVPLDLGPPDDQLFLILYGTGIRGRSSLTATVCTIGGTNAEVLYAGDQGGFVGLDQVNVRLPRALIGRGEVDVIFKVDGKIANTVRVSIR
jgi:uncharacterized protein (TIGR03437 family)